MLVPAMQSSAPESHDLQYSDMGAALGSAAREPRPIRGRSGGSAAKAGSAGKRIDCERSEAKPAAWVGWGHRNFSGRFTPLQMRDRRSAVEGDWLG